MCLLTNERYKTYQKRFSFGRLGHALGVELGGTVAGWGGGGVKKMFFEIQPDLVCDYLHEWHNVLGPRPLQPWGGAKRSNII